MHGLEDMLVLQSGSLLCLTAFGLKLSASFWGTNAKHSEAQPQATGRVIFAPDT